MASETSSAVLELNDADTEDTDATTVTDETHEGLPLIMEHGYDIAVKVDAPMKQLSTLETFVTYRVRCVCARWPTPPLVRRRYNHFKLLHKRLGMSQPLLAPPPLPPLHSARQQLDRYSPAFVAVRSMALNAFLERVAKHPILTHSADFRIFMTTPDEELDKVFRSENSAMNLWGLSGAIYGSGESKTGNGPRVKDPEFTSAAEYLQSLQQKLATLCAITTKLHKGTAALSNEMFGMKRACDAWATQARGRAARGAAACAGGAAAGAAAAAASLRVRHHHQAVLPLLAAYANAHVEKIKQRDAIHAAYVSGNNTDGLHNRLEQASEALRSELSDWNPKTRADIKTLLLDLAERQLALHTQSLQGWENALKMSTETNIDEIFKTVSKTAVQNLSPSKCRSEMTPTETERDLDDFSEDFDINSCHDDLYGNDVKVNGARNDDFPTRVVSDDGSDSKTGNDLGNTKIRGNIDGNVFAASNPETHVKSNLRDDNISDSNDSGNTSVDITKDIDNLNESKLVAEANGSELNESNQICTESQEFLTGILNDTDTSVSEPHNLTATVKNEVICDPLRDFSDVDLS